jgi:hypothetical protein
MRWGCIIATVFASLLSGHANGQTTTSGALSGVVVDPSGAVVPAAVVEVGDVAKGNVQTTKSNDLGAYQFSFLRPGQYTLMVEHPGFQQERRSVSIQVGPTVTVNITMRVAAASSEMSVTAEAPLIQADNADVAATFTQKQISEIPNPGNDLTYIAQTTPGAVMNTDGGSMSKFSILGMPGFSYDFRVDGMSITENSLNVVRGGPLGLTLGANQIQEATVVSSPCSGQFGNAAGGNISYVSKSGSNFVHGNAEYFWNGTALNANDWFNQAFGNPRPFSVANQWAGSLGAPIRKNKLFFFLDTEGLRLDIPQILFTVIPTPQFEAATIVHIDAKFGAGSASDRFYQQIFNLYDQTPRAASAAAGGFADPLGCTGFQDPLTGLGITVPCARNITNVRSRPSQDTLTSGRVDWNIGQNDRAFLRLQREGGLYAQSDDPINSIFDGDYDNSRWQAQVLESHTFGSQTANQFLVGVSGHYWAYKSRHPGDAQAAFPTVLDFSLPGTFTSLGGFNSISLYAYDIHTVQISEDLAWIHGNHKLSFGVGFDRQHWDTYENVDLSGELKPQTLRAFYEGGFDASSDVDFTTLVQAFTSKPKTSVKFGGFQVYVGDEWRVRKNVVLTLAIRAEHVANFSCENHCFSRLIAPFEEINHDPATPYNQVLITNQKHALQRFDSVNWSPRIGFAWQPLGVSRNSVLRGGIGILYDPFQSALAEEFWLNPPNYNSYNAFRNNLTPNETKSLFKDTAASNNAFVNGYAAGKSLAELQGEIPNFISPWLESAERRMHRPQYQRWSLEWEQALGANTAINFGYFGHHGIHELVRNPNANAYGFGSLPPSQCGTPPVLPCSDPRFGEVEQWASRAVSNYHGLVTSFRHQFHTWGSGLVQLNYTYGHALDEVSNNGVWGFTQGSSLSSQDPANLRGAYGPAEYDVRHSMNANYVWEIPLKTLVGGRGPSALLNGWQVSGTVFARTGFPYSVFDTALSGNLQQNNYFGQIYAVPVGTLPEHSECGRSAAFNLNVHPCLPPQIFVQDDGSIVPNPNAPFVQTQCETDFNKGHLPSRSDPCGGPLVTFAQGRNRFRGPSYFNADLALMKITRIPKWENGSLAIGFQFFNVLNHPNFGTPTNSSSDPGFGLIYYGEQGPSGILGDGNNGSSRMIQVKAELRF